MTVPEHLPEGDEKRVEIQVHPETRKTLKRVMSDIDPDMSYRDFLRLSLYAYEDKPSYWKRRYEEDYY